MKPININNIICIRVKTNKGKPLNDYQIGVISKKYNIDYLFLKDLANSNGSYPNEGYIKVWLLRTESFDYELVAFTKLYFFENCPKELWISDRYKLGYVSPYRDIIESMNFDLNTIKPIDFPPFTKPKVLTPEKIENKINSILDKINAKVKKTGMTVNEAKESLSENEKLFLKSLQEK